MTEAAAFLLFLADDDDDNLGLHMTIIFDITV